MKLFPVGRNARPVISGAVDWVKSESSNSSVVNGEPAETKCEPLMLTNAPVLVADTLGEKSGWP